MKKQNKSTLLAVLFFGAMFFFGAQMASAQSDSISRALLTGTTGAEVLPAGRVLWSNQLQVSSFSDRNDLYDVHGNAAGLESGLRVGIGSQLEATLDVNGFRGFSSYTGQDEITQGPYWHTAPTVGLRYRFLEGRGILPTATFFTRLGMNGPMGDWFLFEATVGVQLREQLGRRWLLDGSLAYAWNSRTSPYVTQLQEWQYSLFARFLASDRLMFGVGLDNVNGAYTFRGAFETRYQCSPSVQTWFQLGACGGSGPYSTYASFNAMLGASWMLRGGK